MVTQNQERITEATLLRMDDPINLSCWHIWNGGKSTYFIEFLWKLNTIMHESTQQWNWCQYILAIVIVTIERNKAICVPITNHIRPYRREACSGMPWDGIFRPLAHLLRGLSFWRVTLILGVVCLTHGQHVFYLDKNYDLTGAFWESSLPNRFP